MTSNISQQFIEQINATKKVLHNHKQLEQSLVKIINTIEKRKQVHSLLELFTGAVIALPATIIIIS